jgi:competence protein ComEC
MLPDGHVLAVDAPGRRGSRFNGGVIAAEALRAMGLTHADVLAATHAQSDHMGGMISLMGRLNRVGELWLPDVPAAHRRRMARELVAMARKRGAMVRWLAQGDVVRLGQVTARTLWPPRGYAPANPNDASLVLSLVLPGGKRLLLPGDVEARGEADMIRAGIGRHDLALMPHHGSVTSSTPAFARAVHPALAIAQTGAGNRYGFPNSEAVRRWRRVGAAVANTADGAVLVDLSGGGVSWRHAPPVRSARRAWALRLWRRG